MAPIRYEPWLVAASCDCGNRALSLSARSAGGLRAWYGWLLQEAIGARAAAFLVLVIYFSHSATCCRAFARCHRYAEDQTRRDRPQVGGRQTTEDRVRLLLCLS